MTTDSWCPENELSWIMEQVERRDRFMVEENRKLQARLAEAEIGLAELQDAKRKLDTLERLVIFAADRLEAAGLPGHTTHGENMRACDEVREALVKLEG